ncbi:MAG: polysaccharide deacetylase family protein [Syntrophorhabdaceae bacterium]|nr:polysaccharide deacetylase family protein [Syntrophorhabdaceae bacterium]
MEKIIGIKVDVDTYKGMREGVPRLLQVLETHRVKGSFFIPMGRDDTGWTGKRVFTRKGFLKKAGRVGVIGTYGIKTLLYGTLLPGPKIAMKNDHIIRDIKERGHEIGIHGLNHVYWHDHIKFMGKKRTREELIKAFDIYESLLGEKPLSFAAPGWMINGHALEFFEERGLVYTSNTRGVSPFYPILGGRPFSILEIPTTLPTLDEIVGLAGFDNASLCRKLLNSLTDGLNIITIHAELEGKKWAGLLVMFIEEAIARKYRFLRLIDIAEELKKGDSIKGGNIVYGFVEGRAGEVSIQGE